MEKERCHLSVRKHFTLIVLLCSFLLLIGGVSAQEPITLQFFYPVGVAGPLAQAIDSYVAEFNSTP